MLIKFLFTDIKNNNEICKKVNDFDASSYDKVAEKFRKCIDTLKCTIPEIKNINRTSEKLMYGLFEYYVETDIRKYKVSLTVDTYKSDSYLSIVINSQKYNKEETDYDFILEEIKFGLKRAFEDSWENCFWMIDEQSEDLSRKVYKIINAVENKFRVFADLVLREEFGPKWFNTDEFKFAKNFYEKNSKKFINISQRYLGINDILISTTMETLIRCITTTDKDEKLGGKNRTLISRFSELFSNIKNPLDIIYDFKDVRNHIAHNKPIDYRAYIVILEKVCKMKKLLEEAEKKINAKNYSIQSEKNAQIEFDMRLAEYQKKMIDYSCGSVFGEYVYDVVIRNKDEIIQFFIERLNKIYNEVKQSVFRFGFNISSLNVSKDKILDKQKIFKIYTNRNGENKEYIFYVSFNSESDSSAYNIMHISLEDKERVFVKEDIEYDNGEIIEDYVNEYVELISECWYDIESEKEFVSKVNDWVYKLCTRSIVH